MASLIGVSSRCVVNKGTCYLASGTNFGTPEEKLDMSVIVSLGKYVRRKREELHLQ